MHNIFVSEKMIDKILNLKSEECNQENRAVVKKNYNKIASNFYCAVFLDIDGTVIENKDEEPSQDIVQAVSDLVRRKVTICFVTGRGRTGARNALINLASAILKSNTDLDWSYFSRWHCITHHGVYLLTSQLETQTGFLSDEESIVDAKRVEQFSRIRNNLCDLISDTISNIYSLTTIKNNGHDEVVIGNYKITFEPVSYRIITPYKSEELKSEEFLILFETISQAVEQYASFCDKINVIKGIYQNKIVIEIGIADKNDAVTTYNNTYLGVDPNKIVRIADNGATNEVDFTFLNCHQGFSVNTIQNSLNACMPVIDFANSGKQKVLTGMDATCYLLSNLNIYPTLCLKIINEKIYQNKLARIEYEAKQGSQKIMGFYSNRMNWFDFLNDSFSQSPLHNIFDYKSGAILFSDTEWNSIINDVSSGQSCFKKLVLSMNTTITDNANRPQIGYFMHTDKGVIFRGASVYYFFFYRMKIQDATINGKISSSQAQNTDEWKNWTVTQAKSWFKDWITNLKEFVRVFYECIQELVHKQSYIGATDRKLIIGGFDNLRHSLLVIINAYINLARKELSSSSDKDVLIILDRKSGVTPGENLAYINGWIDMLEKILKCMYEFTFSTDVNRSLLDFFDGKFVDEIYKLKLADFQSFTDKELITDVLRSWRETDFIVENFAAVEIYLRRQREIANQKEFVFWGLPYGSIELPIIAKILCERYNMKGSINYIMLYGNYDGRHKNERDAICEYYENINDWRKSKDLIHVLVDDNITTAKTLELAVQCLAYNKIYVNDIIVVRYLSLNRLQHIVGNKEESSDMLTATAPQLDLFFNTIKGLVRPSPYSKLFKFGLNKAYKKEYEDELHVFDKSKERILGYLIKNYGGNKPKFEEIKCTDK